MEPNQNTGSERQTDYTQQDEEKMDRVAQAGVEGALGAAEEGSKAREQMREDAEVAFGGAENTGGGGNASQPGSGSTTGA